MKLLQELTERVDVLTEKKEDGSKSYFIEGIFMQGDIGNRNGRIYPSQILAKEVARYTKDLIDQNRAYGELGHPNGPTINLDRVSHMFKSLRQEGSNFIGKAKIMTETPMGKIVKSLLDEGANLGVSSRGLGSLKSINGLNEVQDDFLLATAGDIVADPSAPSAFVKGVMEGADWIYDERYGWKTMEVADSIHNEMKKLTTKQIQEQKVRVWERFLHSIA